MPRMQLNMPAKVHYSCNLTVRVTDMNYGAHLGNDALLSLVHEARMLLLHHFGFGENDIDGYGLLLADAIIIYKSQARWQDTLTFNMTITDFNKYGADIYYDIRNKKTGKEVARVKTNIVIFDYENQKIVNVPEKFKQCFE